MAIPQTTGFQYRAGGAPGVMVADRDGKVVAWTIRLASLDESQISFFETQFGGAAAARITVLRKLKDKRKKGSKKKQRNRYVVTGQSDLVKLQPYFGVTAQFPLDRTLTVRKGYVVALTVPTWAPSLAVGVDNSYSWRGSRPKKQCDETSLKSSLAFSDIGQFDCLYRTARLAYSATLVSTP